MEFLNVLAAALAAFAFGAVWYMSMSKAWLAAAEIPVDANGRPTRNDGKGGGATPFVIGLIAMVLVAGMMRHMLTVSGVTSIGGGLVAGAGVGAFFITPWVAMNYGFSMRKPALTAIDGVNSIVGCAIMGAVLNLF